MVSADSKDSVAIIILNHNKKNDVLECLQSVHEQSYKNYEVIVVDNASTDNSVEGIKTRFPHIQIVENLQNMGAPEGRNIGWKYLEKDFDYNFILFLDDDSVIDKNFLSNLLTIFNENSKVGIACGKAYTNNKFDTIMSAGINANLYTGSIYDRGAGRGDSKRFDKSGYVDACGAFGLMIRKELFVSLGGFDKHYSPYGWEDVDICLRAKRRGYYTYFSSNAVMIHKGTKLGRKPNPVYEKNKIKNYIYLLRTNTNLFQKFTCALFLPFRAAALAGKLISSGNGKIIIQHFKGLFIGINDIRVSLKSK